MDDVNHNVQNDCATAKYRIVHQWYDVTIITSYSSCIQNTSAGAHNRLAGMIRSFRTLPSHSTYKHNH